MKKFISLITAAVLLIAVSNVCAAWSQPIEFSYHGPVLNRSMEPEINPKIVLPDDVPINGAASIAANYDYSALPQFETAAEAGEYWSDCVHDRLSGFGMVIKAHGEREDEVQWQDIADKYYADIIKAGQRHTGEPDRGDYLRQICDTYGGFISYAVYNDGSPKGNRIIAGYIIVYEPGGYYSTAEQEAELGILIEELIGELGIQSTKISPYDKICAVYDWICENITYDYDNLYDDSYVRKHSAYAALKDRTCVCSGYALLFYRIMLTLGIDCRYITGYVSGGYHAWNIVNLYGEYFLLDSTWDAGSNAYGYFLLGTDSEFSERDFDEDFETADFKSAYSVPLCPYMTHSGARIGSAPQTCTKAGQTGSGICPDCGKELMNFGLPALGHRFENGICSVCKRTEPAQGDLNDDGKVDVSDGVIMQRVLAELEADAETADFGDFDRNGITDVSDGIVMQQILANIE